MSNRQVIVGNSLILEIEIKNLNNDLIDADSTPSVEIIDSGRNIVQPLSSSGVIRVSLGKYQTSYTPSLTARTGVWVDRWVATVNSLNAEVSLNFIVLTQQANIEEVGAQIGDAPEISYSNEEIIGINILLSQLKARLKNDTEIETTDAYGNLSYTTCSIFTNEELVYFLKCSLSEFNQTPHFTNFNFSMQDIYDRFAYVIIEGAYILALSAQILLEGGREFNINDNGVSYTPPQLSNILNNQLSQFVSKHTEALKYIKNSIKPHPVGFGAYRLLASAPQFQALRHLRERRII